MKKLSLILFALTLFNSTYAKDYSEMVVIGDSLNDNLTGKSMPMPNINLTNSEIVYNTLFNKPLIDYRLGGTNFSKYGSRIFKDIDEVFNTGGFDRKNPGTNNLYYVLLGDNDVIQLEVPFLFFSHQATEYFNDKITSHLQEIVQMVGNHGENTVIVSTIPDISLTPAFSQILVSPPIYISEFLYNTFNIKTIYPMIAGANQVAYQFSNTSTISNFLKILGIYTDRTLREFSLNYPSIDSNQTPAKYFKKYTKDLYKNTLIGNLPFIENIYDYLFKIVHNDTVLFNQTYINKIYTLADENILILDLNGFLNEIFQQQQKFGIDNIVGVGCPNGTLAAEKFHNCEIENGYYTETDKVYAFADLVHPSAELHLATAQYILAALTAPVQYSSLAAHGFTILKNNQNLIQREIVNILNNQLTLHQFNFIGNLSINRNRTIKQQGIKAKDYINPYLNLGFIYKNSTSNNLGALLSINLGHNNLSQGYHVRNQSFYLSIWDNFEWSNGYWSTIQAGIGKSIYTDIERKINIFKGHIIGLGSTQANSFYFNTQVGKKFEINPSTKLMPFFGFTHENVHLKGYTEGNESSTSMAFDDIHFKHNYVSVGTSIIYKKDNTTLSGALSLNQSINYKEAEITSGLKQFSKRYSKSTPIVDKRWLNIQLGANQQLTPTLSGQVSTGVSIGNNTKSQFNLNFGLNYKF